MKKLFLFLSMIVCFNQVKADDTAALQALLGAPATLPAHHATYHTSAVLNITHNFNLNGNEINFTPANGQAINITGNSVKVYNGKVTGANGFVYGGSSYCSGIKITGQNDTVQQVKINTFTGTGVLGGASDGNVLLNCNISKIGYIAGFFVSDNGRAYVGGTVAFDTLDRSMISPTTITQPALIIRGGTNFPSSNWNVHHNIISQPFNPIDITSEGCEIRFAPYTHFWANTCISGSIGCSVVVSDFVTVNYNIFIGNNQEGIEYADCKNGWCSDNLIKSQLKWGILIDGVPSAGNVYNKFLNNTILNCASYGIHITGNSHDCDIMNCNISNCPFSIDIQGGFNWNFYNNSFDGVNNSQQAIVIEASIGGLVGFGNKFSNFINKGFKIYNHPATGTTTKTNNIVFKGSSFVNTAGGYNTDLGTGGTVGSNISIN